MVSFSLTAVNIGTHPLGESDRIVVMFTRERGLHRAVAKGARKPGTKMVGKSEPLMINRLLLSRGKNLDIITQCESIESFSALRQDLVRLSYALYYAELTQIFGQELSEESERFFDRLSLSIGMMADLDKLPALQALEFEMAVLKAVGLSPELTYCVGCRRPMSEQALEAFNYEHGGIVCHDCFHRMRQEAYGFDEGEITGEDGRVLELAVREHAREGQRGSIFVSAPVWKRLVLARGESEKFPDLDLALNPGVTGQRGFTREELRNLGQANRLMRGYIEYKSGRKLKSLELLDSLPGQD